LPRLNDRLDYLRNIAKTYLLVYETDTRFCSNLKPEEIFAVHPKIRWAGFATNKGAVIFAQMRKGVTSFTPDSNKLTDLEVRSQYIIESAELENKWVGALDHITFCFEKYVELIVPLKDGYVAINLERDVPCEAYPKISKSIRELE
jgi:hypothetical protein